MMSEDEKSYPFYVYSGLLTPTHVKQLGSAWAVFLWCLNKTTHEENGVGFVCGEQVISASDIAKDVGGSRHTIYRHLQRLETFGYINLEVAGMGGKGWYITVLKSKRWTKNTVQPVSDVQQAEYQPVSDVQQAEYQPVSDVQQAANYKDARTNHQSLKPKRERERRAPVDRVFALIDKVNKRLSKTAIPPNSIQTQLQAHLTRLTDEQIDTAIDACIVKLESAGDYWSYLNVVLKNFDPNTAQKGNANGSTPSGYSGRAGQDRHGKSQHRDILTYDG